MAKTIVGLYATFDTVRDVFHDLEDNGIRREDISLVADNVRGQFEQYTQGAHAALGAIAEMVSGMGVIDTQDLGTVIATGPMVGVLSNLSMVTSCINGRITMDLVWMRANGFEDVSGMKSSRMCVMNGSMRTQVTLGRISRMLFVRGGIECADAVSV